MQKADFKDRFYEAILTLKTKEECDKFFSDACTPKEIETIAQRFVVAQLINEKKVYSEIIEETGASTATISRVNRAINEGFHLAFERLKK